ncbi:hypothetical protein K470DRAFT_244136 [Piedraia hortae CBS 480.64]|uniref:Rad1-domain-containing protein n=1 Tax=Piedraia hortae CBS 480.64 TaxID=1314780 RepID=A0A6A7C373_9PEZI|nr:hypothetical protein K470DRAFT_244136 [Piedraia hortae CBS 480.64]
MALFSAVFPSARQLLVLLRCISFAKNVQVHISAQGLRFSSSDGSVMEASIFIDSSLFTSYNYQAAASSQDPPVFEINTLSLMETLNIFSLSDPSATKRATYDIMSAQRMSRQVNAFSTQSAGVIGVCTFSYDGEGRPLRLQMAETGVSTTCDLTTYEAATTEEIPFDRNALALKTIMRASDLLEAVNELTSMNPPSVTIVGSPFSSSEPDLSVSATGAYGSATVTFRSDNSVSETPCLEMFYCPTGARASFSANLIKASQRAMASALKASLRLDVEGVLSLQFLLQLDPGSSENGETVTFVDFRLVPLVEDEDVGEL